MPRKKIAQYLGRIGIMFGAAFIALGAQERGWIVYSADWEFWLTPIILLFIFIGERYGDEQEGTVGAKRDPRDPEKFYSNER